MQIFGVAFSINIQITAPGTSVQHQPFTLETPTYLQIPNRHFLDYNYVILSYVIGRNSQYRNLKDTGMFCMSQE